MLIFPLILIISSQVKNKSAMDFESYKRFFSRILGNDGSQTHSRATKTSSALLQYYWHSCLQGINHHTSSELKKIQSLL